jgi:hypothetical protein
MSKTIPGFMTGVAFGVEGTQGVQAATFPYLWAADESDSLSMEENPYDATVLRGARGQVSSGFRSVQHLPGGGLPAAPISIGTACGMFLAILQAHLQGLAVVGTSAPFTYTGSPAAAPPDDGDWFTLSIMKATGIEEKYHRFLGCIPSDVEIAWKAGEPMTCTPSAIKAMSADCEGTLANLPNPSVFGFLQAPRIACTWNGTEVNPANFSIKSHANFADRQSGNARGRVGHALGDYSCGVEIGVWRHEESAEKWVDPFFTGAVGTLVITGYPATVTLTGGLPPTFTFTAHLQAKEPNPLNTGRSDLIDKVTLGAVADSTLPVFSLTQQLGTLLG